MFSIFAPSYVKEGRQFIKDAHKMIAYKRDLVTPETVVEVEREIDLLKQALNGRNREAVHAQMKRLDEVCGKLDQPKPDAAWRENVEVFLVAVVIALAVRTYFLQPFTIPTGSMQPTLNGIIGTRQTEPPPNFLVQALQTALWGRTYVNVLAEQDEAVAGLEEVSRGGWRNLMTYTRVVTTAGNTYWARGNRSAIESLLNQSKNEIVKAGEPLIRGYIDTGDHVFVDKFTYHFRQPKNDQVFVFATNNIPGITAPGGVTQYYIKRLAGLPGQTLRIASPQLFINGVLATQFGYARVMSGSRLEPHQGYRGYGNGREMGFPLLNDPNDKFEIPEKQYFALGDNSYNSSDSRNWGTVPQQNIMGRAVFVYWPFNRHWSFIR